MSARTSAMISRCARCCTAVGRPAASNATRTSCRVRGVGPASIDSSTPSAEVTTSSVSPSRQVDPGHPALDPWPGDPLHPAQVVGREQVPGGAQHVGAHPAAGRLLGEHVGIRRAGRASACRATTRPAVRPATARTRAAARRRRRAAGRPTRAAGWRAAGGERGRGGGLARAHPRTGTGPAPSAIVAGPPRPPPGCAKHRPSAVGRTDDARHRPSAAHLSTGRPVAGRCPWICRTPGAESMHEDSPPAHRSPQPPPGRSL